MPEGLQAGGNITPKSIVRLSASAGDNVVIQAAAATAPLLGIAGQGTRYAEITGLALNDGYAAVQGQNVLVFRVGECAPVIAGAGGLNAGDLVTSDANGNGVTATTDGQFTVGTSLQTVPQGAAAEIQIQPGQRAS
jgi:hypothetical protein